MSLEIKPKPRFSILRMIIWGLSWLALPIGIVVLAYLVAGRSISEKTATAMLLPTGLLCWFPLVYGVKTLLHGKIRTALIPIFLGLFSYVVSNPIVSSTVVKSLESKYPPIDFENIQPFNSIVVLGGGTWAGPNKLAHLSGAGDRVSFACRLYHLQLTKKIMVTGDPLRGTAKDDYLDASKQAKRILIESGVAASDIVEIDGTNTSEEMLSLKECDESIKGKRCGLITSAFHIPRAMRLAHAVGLDLVPIPTDFHATNSPRSFSDFIPSSNAYFGLELALKEYLAKLIGR